MLQAFVPSAYAQAGLPSAAANAAQEGTQTGITTLITFVAKNIDNWIAGGVILIIFWILSKMLASTARKAILKKGDDVHEASLVLVERVTSMTVLTIGFAIAFAINGLNFTAVIGALSLGIGFALKDIIGNFISGVIMLAQNRIRIGDLIKVGDILGTIVNIDVRATVLQAIDGTEVVIPNQTMLGETLISYSTNPFRRVELIVGVDYGTDLPMVTSLVKGIIDKDPDIVPQPESLVLVDEFGDSAINIKILFWIESSNNWMKVRSNLSNRIKKAFDELNINIPFPIRTLKVDENDRSFLQTMQSMKQGLVPEMATVPAMDQVRAAAESTAQAQSIPVDLIQEQKPQGDTTPKPAAESEHVENNQPELTPEEQLAQKNKEAAEAAKPEPEAPPTHL